MKTRFSFFPTGWSFLVPVAVALWLAVRFSPAPQSDQEQAKKKTQTKPKTKTQPKPKPKVTAKAQKSFLGHRVFAQVALPANLPILDVRDFGAKGDGVSNDTAAFAALAKQVNARDGGVKVVIPPGTYLVGGQTPNGRGGDGRIFRFQGRDVFILRDCKQPVQIEASGAILRLPDGLHFGSFDAQGNPMNPKLPFWESSAAGETGFTFGAVACADVRIKGLELDGRSPAYILGGAWGDRERQTASYGFYFESCQRVELDEVSAHHFGLDGIYIKAPGLRANATPRPHFLRGCRFEWNGRQGLSWSGGIGLRAKDCLFAHTGQVINERSREQMWSAPGAGVDIEAEGAVCRDGVFENCEFLHTRGPALYCEVGDNADVLFHQSRFWNFSNYSIIPNAPRLVFSDCQIYGAAVNAFSSRERPSDATRFLRCTFEDKAHPQYGQPFADAYQALFAFDKLRGGVSFEECTFLAHQVKGPFIRLADPQTRGFSIRGGRMVLEHFNAPNESIATIQGGAVRGLRVESNFSKPAPPGLHIWTNGQNQIGPGVEVVGPGVRWRAPNGETGTIAAAVP